MAESDSGIQQDDELPSKTSEGRASVVEKLIAPTLEDMGYEIVRVLLSGRGSPTLQIMVDRKDGAMIDVEDCAAVSRAASAILDVEDPIDSEFTLEVSSPGLDRPLTRLGDFARFAGFEARIEMEQSIDGHRRVSGRLLGVEGTKFIVETAEGMVKLPFAGLKKAKLLLTDALIEAMQKEAEQFSQDAD